MKFLLALAALLLVGVFAVVGVYAAVEKGSAGFAVTVLVMVALVWLSWERFK